MKKNSFIIIFTFIFAFNHSFNYAYASDTKLAVGATTSVATPGAANSAATTVAGETGSLQKLQNFFDSPMGILTISGIATVFSGILYSGAAKQEEESKNNRHEY